MEINICNRTAAMRSRLVAPISLAVKGGVRPQAAADATFMGPRSWSPPLT